MMYNYLLFFMSFSSFYTMQAAQVPQQGNNVDSNIFHELDEELVHQSLLDDIKNSDIEKIQEHRKIANINEPFNSLGQTYLMYAAQLSSPAIVEFLISKGAKVNKKNNFGSTALIIAAQHGKVGNVEKLLQAGAHINEQNNNKDTALLVAAIHNKPAVAELLLRYGARPDMFNKQYKSFEKLSKSAAYQKALDDYIVLQHTSHYVHKPNYVRGMNSSQQELLKQAIQEQNVAKISSLFTASTISLNVPLDEHKRTALMYAVPGKEQIVQLLLHERMFLNINQQDRDGVTALMYAVDYNKPATVKLLLDAGADCSIQDHEGNTVMDRAIRMKNKQLQEILQKYCDIVLPSTARRSPLTERPQSRSILDRTPTPPMSSLMQQLEKRRGNSA